MYFQDIIGQSAVKKLLSFYLEGYKTTSIVPHLMFTAPRGSGKTIIATAMAKHLHDISNAGGVKKPLVTLNCSSIKTVKQFFNSFVVPHMINRDVSVLFDEASELPKDVTMALLTICNPNKNGANSFVFDGTPITFDFRRLTFMFATTEGQAIFHALMDRMKRVDLSDYSKDELWHIIELGVGNKCIMNKSIMPDVVSVLRGNARKAQQMAEDIVKYCSVRRNKNFNMADWIELKDMTGILPLGLLKQELYLLRVIAQKIEVRLTELAAVSGLSRGSIQKDYEMYLSKMRLIEISTAGRKLTVNGKKYVDATRDV